MEHTKLSRADASAAVTRLGWRYVLGEFRTEVLTGSLPLAADVAGRAAALPDVEGHLRMDIRADRLLLSLQTAEAGWVTTRDAELARRLSALTEEFRLTRRPGASRPRWRRAASSCPTRRRPRSGCWPTPRATRPASPPGRAATRASGFRVLLDLGPEIAVGAGGDAAGGEGGDRGPLHGHALDHGERGDGGGRHPRPFGSQVLRDLLVQLLAAVDHREER